MTAHGGVGVLGDSAACGEPGGGHAAHGGVGGPSAPYGNVSSADGGPTYDQGVEPGLAGSGGGGANGGAGGGIVHVKVGSLYMTPGAKLSASGGDAPDEQELSLIHI